MAKDFCTGQFVGQILISLFFKTFAHFKRTAQRISVNGELSSHHHPWSGHLPPSTAPLGLLETILFYPEAKATTDPSAFCLYSSAFSRNFPQTESNNRCYFVFGFPDSAQRCPYGKAQGSFRIAEFHCMDRTGHTLLDAETCILGPQEKCAGHLFESPCRAVCLYFS